MAGLVALSVPVGFLDNLPIGSSKAKKMTKKISSKIAKSSFKTEWHKRGKLNNVVKTKVRLAGIKKELSASSFYRPGLGCTTLVGERSENLKNDLKNQHFEPLTPPELPDYLYWPAGTGGVTPIDELSATYDHDTLDKAIDFIFGIDLDPDHAIFKKAIDTQAVLVIHNGQLIKERYKNGYNQDTRFVGWSMSKTVLGMAMGTAQSEFGFDVNDPVKNYIPAFDNEELLIDHVLRWRTGIDWKENYDAAAGTSDVQKMLYHVEDTV